MIDSKQPLITKEKKMKKKLLVLLIAVIPTLMPNLVFAVAIDVEVDAGDGCFDFTVAPCTWCAPNIDC